MTDDFDDVLPNPPEPNPPPFKGWKVTVSCHIEDFDVLDKFVENVQEDFAAFWPEVESEISNDDRIKLTMRMVWHSPEIEFMLEQMVPEGLAVKQVREG